MVASMLSCMLVPTVMLISAEKTNVVQIFTQIAFYLYAKSVKFPSDDTKEIRRNRSIFLGVLSYFSICNFAIWLENSFIETRSFANIWQNNYFKSWRIIHNVLNPLALG